MTAKDSGSSNEAYMKDKFEVKIETLHAADKGTQENIHKLDAEALKVREIVYVDIASKKIPKNEDQPNIREFKYDVWRRRERGGEWKGPR